MQLAISEQARILIVDDAPSCINLLAGVLEREFELQSALNGRDALDLIHQAPPDLVLLDVMMPGMDGYEVCRRLQADSRYCRIPVIFITAKGEAEAEVMGLRLGAVDYLAKPINVELARQRIRNVLEREQLRKEIEAQRDQLESKVAERTLDLSLAKEAAEAANRAKTAFLANMSHELRTPMNAIMGLTEIVKRKATDPQQISRLTTVAQAAGKLLVLIDNILDFSKSEAEQLQLEYVDFTLSSVLDKLSDANRQSALEKGLSFSVEVAHDLVNHTFHGDPVRLGQVLHNLVGNAVRFTVQGSVSVRAFVANDAPTGILLRFEVSDTGIGISSEDQKRLFARFEQADNSPTRKHGGLGLGLAMAKRLAQAMGGDINCQSHIGSGSSFWFTAKLNRVA